MSAGSGRRSRPGSQPDRRSRPGSKPGRARAARDRSAPPALLEPILAIVERIERRLRHVRPIRAAGGILGLEQTLWSGAATTLRDGTTLRPGSPVGELHVRNTAIREAPADAWMSSGLALARDDLAVLASWARRQPPDRRPVAYHGTTILWPLARRAGFEVRRRPQTRRARLDDWYLRGVLARWSRIGRARLRRGRGPLETREVWLSARELDRLHPPASPDAMAVPGPPESR